MFRNVYISRGFFVAFAACTLTVLIGFYIPFLLYVGQFAVLTLLALTFLDGLILFSSKAPVEVKRILPQRMNLGDEETILISVKSTTNQPLVMTIYDEAPVEMQARNLGFHFVLRENKSTSRNYSFTPKRRGVYVWGDLHVFIRSFLSLLKRRIIVSQRQETNVYPSVRQMKQYEFRIFNQQTRERGIKKIRRLGHNNEFEQIKNYVQGDDPRTINWKATSRGIELMVNQYQAQRSQLVYSVIDKSRSMEHEFEGLTLLDYSINAALVFSNIALRKGDKVGLITFSDKIGTQLMANSAGRHLQRILDLLYAQRTHFLEANYPLLYQCIRKIVPSRALLMLYTNFETELAMRRSLPMLKKISQKHLLVVVFFENTTLQELSYRKPATTRDIYLSTVAEDVINIKRRIAIELNRHGIQTVLTTPEELSMDTLNKYLELKSKGLI
ncbi:MAG: DUF58 domain-containing protein [Brumimicrobium sp.]|nr:DUF58 domain-containing protein [Brumimicrobium sp.]